MTTSSITRVTASFTDVEDATAFLLVENGGFYDVSIQGTWAGVVTLECRTPPGGGVGAITTYTANVEEPKQFGSSKEVRLRFSTDTSGTVTAELSTRAGKTTQ